MWKNEKQDFVPYKVWRRNTVPQVLYLWWVIARWKGGLKTLFPGKEDFHQASDVPTCFWHGRRKARWGKGEGQAITVRTQSRRCGGDSREACGTLWGLSGYLQSELRPPSSRGRTREDHVDSKPPPHLKQVHSPQQKNKNLLHCGTQTSGYRKVFACLFV